MKQKLMIKLTAVVTTVATVLGGCGIVGETKIEYERLVKALDEGDMATVMSAGEDGYAHVKERGIYSTYEEKEDGEHSKIVYQTTNGIYNTKEKKLYGNTIQEIVTDIENKENSSSNENYKNEHIYDADIMYMDEKINSSKLDVDVSHIAFLLDRLQGISKLEPEEYTKGGSEPNSVAYGLTEGQFQELINDKLNIEYDEFKDASIILDFNSAKDSGTLPMALLEVGIFIDFNKINTEGKNILHQYQIVYSFYSKKGNEKVKEVYTDYKEKYESGLKKGEGKQ